jgi:hypothetical protein
MLKNKKILFIGPIFHDYHLLIQNRLTAMGAIVSFHPERNYGPIFKIINNFFNKRLKAYQQAHYSAILKQIKGCQFDYLFVIRGYMLPEGFVEQFKEMNPGAKLIMYQWDSNRTNPFDHLLEAFDKVFSFDFEDCRQFPFLNYLPLFYSDDVRVKTKNDHTFEYDFFFMGWFYPERYDAVIKFKEFALKNGYTIKAFLFMPFTSYIKEYLRGNKLDRSIISIKHMHRSEYLNILAKTNITVDASSPNQTGLAMRIIEALASGTKILTNNYRIKDDFKIYNESYVAFFDAQAPAVDPLFLASKAPVEIKNLLSLEDWLKHIFLWDDKY